MHATWHPLSQSVVKDLLKVLRECRRESRYFKGFLNTKLSGSVVVPAVLKQLFRSLCNKMEYKLWETTWKALLRDALPGLLKRPDTSADGRGNEITMDHICGEGQWVLAQTQAANLPIRS